MKIGIMHKHVLEINKALPEGVAPLPNDRWKEPDIRDYIDFSKVDVGTFDIVEAKLEELSKGSYAAKYSSVYRKFKEWKILFTGQADTSKPVKKLDLIPAVMKSYFKDSDRKWVFMEDEDGTTNPYFIEEVKYVAAHYVRGGGYVPATTHIDVTAFKQGSKITRKASWRAGVLGKNGKTPLELLRKVGMTIESEKAVSRYHEELNRYFSLQMQVGLQMSSQGVGFTVAKKNDYWSRVEQVQMVRDGLATKVVIEEESFDNNESETTVIDTFWKDVKVKDAISKSRNGDDEGDGDGAVWVDKGDDNTVDYDEDDEEENKNRIELPVHPYMLVFDLDQHQYLNIHVRNTLDYQWDKTLGDKLIMDDADKQLIDMLIKQTGQNVEDIVKGKMRGTIVLATGQPGVGKTLTAEVFSEMIEKPLYNVQCSQLGIDIDTIEKNLRGILDRASRWGAILLIDEADVYIRKRGEDIEQNAIVGVFLRLIEYYRGVLFMTTNMGDSIDDAIISRATALVRYKLPTHDLLKQIWRVLGMQYGTVWTGAEREKLATTLPGISGRTVRNLMKLARMLVGPEGKVTVDMIKTVSQYQALETAPSVSGAVAK